MNKVYDGGTKDTVVEIYSKDVEEHCYTWLRKKNNGLVMWCNHQNTSITIKKYEEINLNMDCTQLEHGSE